MKISIITVCYNSYNTIEKTIQSVLNQTYRNIEYIIIDGYSNDGTIDIINKYKTKIDKILVEKDNGIYSALNKGINLASGDYIGLLHSNDTYLNYNVIENLVKNINKFQSDIFYSNINFVNSSNNIVRFYSSNNFKPWMFRFGMQPAHTSVFIKSELQKKNLYLEDFIIASDFELLLRLIIKQKVSYKYINETTISMLIGGKSTSGLNSIIRLNKEIYLSCKLNNIYTNYLMIYSKYFFKWTQLITKNIKI